MEHTALPGWYSFVPVMRRVSRSSLSRLHWAAFLALAAITGTAVGASDGEDPASRRFTFAAVQRAWDEGGEERVKEWMRALVKRTKKAGGRIPSTGKKPRCGSCHEDLKQYPQSPNASEDLRILLDREASDSNGEERR